MSGNEADRPERPSEVDGTAHLFRALGKIVKVLRRNAGLSQAELATVTHCSEDLISAIERGVRTPQADFLLRADAALRAGGVLAAAVDDVREALARARVRHPDWFQDFAKAEATAVALHYYEVQAVPGILQTPAYAESVFRHRRPLYDEVTIEKRLADRLARQVIFDKWAGTNDELRRRGVGTAPSTGRSRRVPGAVAAHRRSRRDANRALSDHADRP